jgi:hypothetical protein
MRAAPLYMDVLADKGKRGRCRTAVLGPKLQDWRLKHEGGVNGVFSYRLLNESTVSDSVEQIPV